MLQWHHLFSFSWHPEAYRCGWFLCYPRDNSVVLCAVLVNCACLADAVRRSLDMVLGMPSSSVVTACSGSLSTYIRPDPHSANSYYNRSVNSWAAFDAIVTSSGGSTDT